MIINEDFKAVITLLNGNSINITSENICGDVTISSQCVSGSAIELGAVCSAQLSTSFKIEGVNRYGIIGAVINVQIYKGSQWHNAGVYTVTKASRYRDIITITASDNMMLLDSTAFTSDENAKKVNQISQYLQTERSIYDVLNYVLTLAGLELGNTQSEIEAMPNGPRTTILYNNNENAYLRDWLAWCAEFLGGFAYADENGKIRIGQFEKMPSATITNNEISIDTADIADFKIKNFDIAVTCYDENWYKTYTVLSDGESQNTVIYIDFEDNPLAQGYYHLTKMRYSDDIADGETDSERTKQMYAFTGAVWDSLGNCSFRPFQATVHIDAMLTIGQCIQIQDAEGDLYSVNITHHTWTLNGGQQISCIGEDTRLLCDYRNRSAVKRESEKLKTEIKNLSIGITQAEFDALEAEGKLIEGKEYNIIG